MQQVAKGMGMGLCLLAFTCCYATAADASFTGTFSGTGRACNGTLHVRSQTIAWTSGFSTCRRGTYEVLERSTAHGNRRMVFRLNAPGGQCLYKVLALEQVEGTDWTASGYPSLEAFRNKDLPEWRDSSLPERLVLECPMTQWR